MRSGAIPFQFEIASVLSSLARSADARSCAVRLSLPFVNFLVCPSEREKAAAVEIIVRAADRRVLSAQECCDNCIDNALRSLQELRGQLVEKQVELSGERKGSLYQLIELMLVAIRQFLTFEQKLARRDRMGGLKRGERIRSPEDRQTYFDALELLRGHLSRSLGQITVIADMNLPSDGLIAGYQGAWPINAYKPVDAAKFGIRSASQEI